MSKDNRYTKLIKQQQDIIERQEKLIEVAKYLILAATQSA